VLDVVVLDVVVLDRVLPLDRALLIRRCHVRNLTVAESIDNGYRRPWRNQQVAR
jgi:hypothetical protein